MGKWKNIILAKTDISFPLCMVIKQAISNDNILLVTVCTFFFFMNLLTVVLSGKGR